MKKLSFMLLGALTATQEAQAIPVSFNGFYVGGHLGGTQRNDKTNLPAFNDGTDVTSALNKTKKISGLTYGFYAGYGQTNNGFYWGVECSLEQDTASKKVTNTVNVIDPLPGVSVRLNTKYERGFVMGLTPRMGVVIGHKNLVYIKVGLEFSRDKVKSFYEATGSVVTIPGSKGPSTVVTPGVTGSSRASKNQVVFVPGIGYERAFGKVLARAEYGYNFGAKIKTGNLIEGIKSPSSVNYTAHVLKFGLAYKF